MKTIPTVALALALAACSKKKTEDCKLACSHLIDLGKADLEHSIKQMGPDGAEAGAKLRAQVAASEQSDLANCISKCQTGKVDTSCMLAAKSLDGALTCTGESTGKTPDDPPATRSESDWPNATLHEVTGAVDGTRFALQVPTELQVANDTSPSDAGWDFPGEPFSQPRFRVSIGPAFPKTVGEGVTYYDAAKDVMKQELTATRFTLIYKSKTFVVVKLLIPSGTKTLECYGTHSSAAGIEDATKLGAWPEKVCATLKAQ
jgi:hypothetical protein